MLFGNYMRLADYEIPGKIEQEGWVLKVVLNPEFSSSTNLEHLIDFLAFLIC